MARTESTMKLKLGAEAPNFCLPDTEGKLVSLDDYNGTAGYLVVFLCNHCPYVIHIRNVLSEVTKEFIDKGIAVFGINSNDADEYPDDSPEMMKYEVSSAGYKFPYLFDATQNVAKLYGAACTPDFFVFDRQKKLVYRGQFDDSRPGNGHPVTGSDLLSALNCLVANKTVPDNQKPSMGCNIKWRKGNEPDYYE